MINLLKNLKTNEITLATLVCTLVIFQVWLELKMPDYMASITKLVQTEGSEMSEILKTEAT